MPRCIHPANNRSTSAARITRFARSLQTPSQIAILGLIATLALVGCRPSEKKVPVYPVSGSISFEGKPPVGAQIVLNPVSGSESGAIVAPVGKVKEDGSFQITTYAEGDGAPAGDYTATVQWFKVITNDGGSGPGPNVLPAKYAKAETSPIKITVKTEPTQVPAILIAN